LENEPSSAMAQRNSSWRRVGRCIDPIYGTAAKDQFNC
jgi:hypothetical protein